MWVRYRFHANDVDFRSVIFPPPGPYWCSGYGDGYSVVIAYLPKGIELTKYWPEASNVSSDEMDQIRFSDRFPEPQWWRDLQKTKNEGEIVAEDSPLSPLEKKLIEDCGLLESVCMPEIRNPGFEKPLNKCHDWRRYVPDPVRKVWQTLTRETRLMVYAMAERQANAEEWD